MESLLTRFSKEELKVSNWTLVNSTPQMPSKRNADITFFSPPKKNQDIFEKMDWDKNGYVTPLEFKSYLIELKKGEEVNTQEVYEAFEQIDKDGSKAIHWQEFYVRAENY